MRIAVDDYCLWYNLKYFVVPNALLATCNFMVNN